MARVLVNPRIGVLKGAPDEASRAASNKMKAILGAFDQMVYDTVSKTYKPATAADL